MALSAHPSLLSPTQLTQELGSHPTQGLDEQVAHQRLTHYGRNQLPPPKQPNLLSLYLKQFLSPLIYLLFGAAAATYLSGERGDAVVVLLVVLFNSTIGFFQEFRARKKMQSLQHYLAPMAKVIRNGQLHKVPATEVTLGDVMIVEAGDRIPADGRLLEAFQLEANEASFTGEALPTKKGTRLIEKIGPLSQQTNMVFMGATITSGSGKAVVTAVGQNTELGKISTLLETARETTSPLTRNIQQLSRILLIGVVGLIGGLLVLSWWRQYLLGEMIQVGISLAVSIIPEGLPVVVTITLSLGIWRMARQKSIIRQLDVVETLGSIDVICTDKTGTLTQGEMMVNAIITAKTVISVSGAGFLPTGEFSEHGARLPTTNQTVRELTRLAFLSSDARVEHTEQGKYVPIGDPTEAALTVVGQKAQHALEQLHAEYHLLLSLPFNQQKCVSAKLYLHDHTYLTIVKGSPEAIADLTKQSSWLLETAKEYAAKGNRLISLAMAETKENPLQELEKGKFPSLKPICNFSLTDPLRADTPEAVAQCRQSGIRVLMVTGDHALTAQHIAEQVGLPHQVIIDGNKALTSSDTELLNHLAKSAVIARATPELKMRLVKLFQAKGEVVAMTGDGVNDAPALKQADVGIAMGRTGSDVSINASDMVLTDDNFSSIVAAIREGRAIWYNLRKVLFYLFSTSVGELMVIGAAVFLQLPLPLLAPQILWLNLVTDGFLDVTLATEGAEEDVMSYPPRGRHETLLGQQMIWRLVFTGLWMAVIGLVFFTMELHYDIAKARTMVLLNLAAIQWFNAWNARSEHKTIFEIPFLSNRALLGGLACCISLQLLAFHWEPLQGLLKTVSLSPTEWGVSIAVASSIVVVDVVWKKMVRPFLPSR